MQALLASCLDLPKAPCKSRRLNLGASLRESGEIQQFEAELSKTMSAKAKAELTGSKAKFSKQHGHMSPTIRRQSHKDKGADITALTANFSKQLKPKIENRSKYDAWVRLEASGQCKAGQLWGCNVSGMQPRFAECSQDGACKRDSYVLKQTCTALQYPPQFANTMPT